MNVHTAARLAGVVLATPLHGYRVLVSRLDRLVIQVTTPKGRFVLKLEEAGDGLTREVAARTFLRARGFPVAAPVARGTDGWEWLLLPWVDGLPLTGESPLAAQQAAGALLARLHAVPGERPPPQQQTWDAWMLGWLRHALTYWLGTGRAPPDAAGRLSRWWRTVEPLLASRGRQVILFDGKPEHLLVTADGQVALIDVEDLRSGDGLMDLAVIALHEPATLPGVLAGYSTLDEQQNTLVAFYTLLRALAAAEWDETQFGGRQRDRFLQVAEQSLPA
ncbi:aminoglycoside phosphotransferase family protein [Deinococcus sp. JMULE3]|uniref:aminoglycoside phosphotransferase family protein n=1 Tax=Deinococcus sp. JMULE3 TaxID=2518341 RepID=UPI0015764466|nr:aminoglycoside phosphotransferase family protein [Deinococcus sp. JMULE3]NTY00407.1 aminoglycoside phosphotransferase family protein [Deinococcus sp. JMULE3]